MWALQLGSCSSRTCNRSPRLDSGGVDTSRVDADAQLVSGLRRGEEQAFTTLVDRYHVRLVRLAATFVSGHEAAEDVAQETWLAVLGGIGGFAGRSPFRSWIFSICANKARSAAVPAQRA